MMKNNIKAVIFDMDGVIVDSEPIQSLSWEKLLIERGIAPIFNEVGLIHEVGPAHSHRTVMQKHNLKEDEEVIIKRRREIFKDLLKEKLEPMPGLLDLIQMLKKEKIKVGVASNRLIEHVYMILNNLQVANHFEVIIGPSPTRKHKPEPDIYLHAVQQIGVKSDQCLAIEDTEIGVIAAKKAGMKVVAIPTRYTKKQDFSKADKIVQSLSEINLELLNSL